MGMIDKPVLIGVLILAVALVVAFSFSNNAVGRKVPAISIGGGGGSTFDECGSDYDCSSGWNCINGICVQNAVTYQGVLQMLSNCDVISVGVPAQPGVVQTGDYVCSNFGKICVYNFIGFDVSGNSTNEISQPISCDDATNNYPTASLAKTICCLPY